MRRNLKRISALSIAVLFAAMSLTGCGSNGSGNDLADNLMEGAEKFEEDDHGASDIDLDSLKESADAIADLKIDTDVSLGGSSEDADDASADDAFGDNTDVPEGDLTVYSYADVYRNGNDITIVPNGGLNASTKLYDTDKDLGSFLDYIDSKVLAKGRYINRDFFYEILAISLVDKDLAPDNSYIESNMMMALAVADNFYSTDVHINKCLLDNNTGTDYNYKVTAYGKDDTWIVNYQDRTFYMNDGGTEYHSEMFKDEYLAAWLVAIDEFYGIQFN